jgi:predicted AlkP superfamily pyrophosphatase or phosphodiesterase
MVEQLLPDYGGKSLYKVPGTVAELLGADVDRESLGRDKEYENVVLVLLDGFGFKHWRENAEDHNFLSNLKRNGDTECLTTCYPSETAAAITTVNTGLNPSSHGLIGWNMYFEDFDASIKTLPFRTQDGEDPSEVYGEDFDKGVLFDGEPIYHLLSEKGVDSHVLVPENIAESSDKDDKSTMFRAAEKIGYDNLSDLSVNIRKSLEEAEGKNYFYIYIPLIDKVSHFEGSQSEEYQAQLSQISHMLQELVVEQLDEEKMKDTLLALTADHGFIDIEPEENIDILKYDKVEKNLKEVNGEKLMPVGSPRNVHLHLKEGKTQEVKQFLEEELEAHIWTGKEAIEEDLFGKEYRKDFEKRIGDLIVCGKNQAIWHSNEPEEIEIKGYHGGLSKQEMQIPFITAELQKLKE